MSSQGLSRTYNTLNSFLVEAKVIREDKFLAHEEKTHYFGRNKTVGPKKLLWALSPCSINVAYIEYYTECAR